MSNATSIVFSACTSGTGETETFVGIGTLASTAGTLLWAGPLTANLIVSNGITPQIAAGQLQITEG